MNGAPAAQGGSLHAELVAVLEKYLSRLNAEGILNNAMKRRGLSPASLRLAHVASFLPGARTVFSGMSPEAAMTVQTMGIEMPHVASALKLETALELVGVRAASAADDDASGLAADDEPEDWDLSPA